MVPGSLLGDSPAANELIKILNKLNDKKMRRKVSSIFKRYAYDMKRIQFIDDNHTRALVSVLLRKHALDVIEDTLYFPQEIKFFMKNMVITLYKQYLRGEK